MSSKKWEKTRNALRDLLEALCCSKCKKNLQNPKQFLDCGHFACFSCINNSNNTCIDCLLDSNNTNFMTDDTLQKILQACRTIAQEIDKVNNNEDVGVKSEEVPLNDIDNDLPNADSNLDNKSSVTIKSTIKSSKKFRKRKKNAQSDCDQDVKKPKLDKYSAILNDPNKINKKSVKWGETVLLQECRKNNVDNVKAFLRAGADPNIPCNAGWTPLQESTDFNYYDVVELLLKGDANVNQIGFEGRTALHEAAKNGNLQIIELLLEYGAKKDILDQSGKAPISYCVTDKAKTLLHLDVIPEVQSNINDEVESKSFFLENDDAGPSTSKRTTRNSCVQPSSSKSEEENIVLKNCIKEEDHASEELAIVYEKIHSINLSIESSKENITNRVFPESPGKENSSTKANTNGIPIQHSEKIVKATDSLDNSFSNNNTPGSIRDTVISRNSTPLSHQSNAENYLQNAEHCNTYMDSEDIIDVEN